MSAHTMAARRVVRSGARLPCSRLPRRLRQPWFQSLKCTSLCSANPDESAGQVRTVCEPLMAFMKCTVRARDHWCWWSSMHDMTYLVCTAAKYPSFVSPNTPGLSFAQRQGGQQRTSMPTCRMPCKLHTHCSHNVVSFACGRISQGTFRAREHKVVRRPCVAPGVQASPDWPV